MKTTLRLTRPKSTTETALYLDINHKRRRKRWGAGLSVHPELWNHEKQRAEPTPYYFKKHVKTNPGLKTKLQNLNTAIEDRLRAVNAYHRECDVKQIKVSSQGLVSYLDGKFKDSYGKQANKTPFLTKYMKEEYIPNLEAGEITYTKNNKRKKYSASTLKSKKRTLRAFIEYEEKNPKIRFDEVDKNFYDKFVNWHQEQGYSTNYIGSHVKEMKVIMKQAYNEGLHSNKFYESDSFITLREEVPSIYLTQEELSRLHELDLEGHLKHYRDIFLVGCYTAMRFSDYSRLKPENIKEANGKRFIEMITQKTKERVVIPIKPELWDIISQEGFFMRKRLHGQKLNYFIKDLCNEAKINDIIHIEKTKGGKSITMQKEKYKLVTTHTARRTGATLMYLANIPTLDIMKITGHKSEKAFLKYICVTHEETADRLSLHPYFQRLKTV